MPEVDRRFPLQLQGPLQGSSGASAEGWTVSALRGLPGIRQFRHWTWIRFLAHYRSRSSDLDRPCLPLIAGRVPHPADLIDLVASRPAEHCGHDSPAAQVVLEDGVEHRVLLLRVQLQDGRTETRSQ